MLKSSALGLKEVREHINVMSKRLTGLSAVHLKAAVVVYQWTMRNFRAQGTLHDRSALHWPPLALSTKLNRIRHRLGTGKNVRRNPRSIRISAGQLPMLMVDGTLRNGFVPNANARMGWVENYVPYAAYHEYGGSVKGRPPQRKMFPDAPQARKLVFPVFMKHVQLSIK